MAYFELEALPNPKVVGEQLISLIKTPMVETIKLPGCVIEVNELFLNHSIRIMGCPGTELCILKNAITLKPENGTIQVDFKECSITMKIPREQTPETRMLFDVHSKASLHLLDCQLKVEHMQEPGSYIITGTSSSIEPEVMKCICINLRSVASVKNGAESFNKICVASPQVFHSANAIVISCSFLQFYTALCMGHNGTAKIEKSGFFRTKGPAIFATNPYKFYLEGSRFENCLENGIELRWENAENSNIEREVKIENNDFNNIRGHGLSLISDSSTLFSSNVYLTNNRVQNCRQDGIYIKSFQASLIEIRRNTVCAVNGNGICVLGTRCSIFYIKLSTIRDNGGCGVYLNESSCTIQECNISANGQSGVAVIGSPGANKVAEEEIEVNIRDSIMGENKQHGIAVMDICNLEVTVSKCKAYANKEYGIFLFYRDNLSTAISQSLSASIAIPAPLKQVGKVLLNGGEIVMNRKGGVHINQLFTHIDGTCIKDNGEYAIFLPIKRSEKYVAFAGSTIGKKCIQGVIGGKWGCVSIYPTGNKCGGACSCIILQRLFILDYQQLSPSISRMHSKQQKTQLTDDNSYYSSFIWMQI
eukprot:TRINITY_DN297_c0_g1_i3.p1 TRINITY_DN297_c0_g1~~TRINITY_DN297_c0_g1_i3.p1  ORF type:complete len:590 (-),score=31.53 TRINITY_DN297_c0_g1_i3:3087-4856(-)